MIDPKTDFVHIKTNNTLKGTSFPDVVITKDEPLVTDITLNILSKT